MNKWVAHSYTPCTASSGAVIFTPPGPVLPDSFQIFWLFTAATRQVNDNNYVNN